jgi:UDP-N-acetylmuramoyl-tripeptide--D-alanyl-D-alanine ligase
MNEALTSFSSLKHAKKMVLLGDMFELGEAAEEEHQTIANLCVNLYFDMVYLIGENFFKTKNNSEKLKTYKSFEDFKMDFKPPTEASLLIKGSRGMALERIIQLL